MRASRAAASALFVVIATTALAGCTTNPPTEITLPPAGAAPDYQLGGAYPPPADVGIVVRDRAEPPADDVYSICYVNAFQTQPAELADWPDELLLKDAEGDIVFDPAWPDEALLDAASDRNRKAIAEVVRPWIERCAAAGYDAVEFDNLDTYARSDGALTFDDNLALAEVLVAIAHDAGLAAGQKNAAEHAAALRNGAGFDFAIAEECAAFDECDAYTDVYGDLVIAVEYSGVGEFRAACEDERMPPSTVLRDRELVAPGEPGYVFELCP
ncbi:endo alpha-1,4 polygalactosaminidase [Microbacterium sp. CFH 31415]|uniref:endo alpha-1,4 polygalactosaminidase n=1 Tax=Microbacterium sp. CFH 31415 TaxID=2921732 RepID=UPI001F144536|nr:endo alpha-1,4 polygalactosaminidase [Microbacterium sp. CFH 31415]MCH6230175.1 endo alpha-1,4 polygalactosaminidase [Microbacterium sp. CFH 31415]